MRQLAFALAGLVCLVGPAAYARDYKVGALEIESPWSRATPKGASVAAGYMKITNTGTQADRLIGGSSDIAAFQIHETSVENGVAKMRPLTNGLEIKPGQTVEFSPGSFHIMFVGLKKPLPASDHVKATLMFEKAGAVDVEFDVLAMGATPGHDMPAMKH